MDELRAEERATGSEARAMMQRAGVSQAVIEWVVYYVNRGPEGIPVLSDADRLSTFTMLATPEARDWLTNEGVYIWERDGRGKSVDKLRTEVRTADGEARAMMRRAGVSQAVIEWVVYYVNRGPEGIPVLSTAERLSAFTMLGTSEVREWLRKDAIYVWEYYAKRNK